MRKKSETTAGKPSRLRMGILRHKRRAGILIVIVGISVLADQMSRSDHADVRTSLKTLGAFPQEAAPENGHPDQAALVLTVIPQPPDGSRFVLKLNSGTTILRGEADLDLVCGRCNTLLAEGVAPGQLPDIVLVCNNCGAFNDTEDCLISED